MEVSSKNNSVSNTQVEAIKKATQVQEQQVLKVLESVQEQSKEVTAQKTGMGNNLNITG
jgi:NADH:ubiquinone oxidoreductase subunit E